jgi:hypothetical protein
MPQTLGVGLAAIILFIARAHGVHGFVALFSFYICLDTVLADSWILVYLPNSPSHSPLAGLSLA